MCLYYLLYLGFLTSFNLPSLCLLFSSLANSSIIISFSFLLLSTSSISNTLSFKKFRLFLFLSRQTLHLLVLSSLFHPNKSLFPFSFFQPVLAFPLSSKFCSLLHFFDNSFLIEYPSVLQSICSTHVKY